MREGIENMESGRRLLRDRGICVIIPTYNNAGTIRDVVSRSLDRCDDVIVVCDGCTDDTVAILDSLERKPVILDIPKNGGKGAALKAGFRYARKAGFAYAITLDGDSQHYPEDIELFLDANRKHPGALIVGSRKGLDSVDRSTGSRFANRFSNFWFALQTGHLVEDTQSGYRLYPLKKLYGLGLLTSRYEAELELLVFAAWHGVEIVSIPVNVYYPDPEQRVSHFRPVRDFARISLLNTVLCVLALVYGLPLFLFRCIDAVIRALLFGTGFIFSTVFVVTPFSLIHFGIGKKTPEKVERLHRIICWFARFACRTFPGVKYTCSNPSCEDFSVPGVVICNHQSYLDLVPMLAQTEKLIVLTAERVYKDRYFGYAIRNAGFMTTNAGLDVMIPRLDEFRSRGYSIVVYPEGTRSVVPDSIARFHQGAFCIAEQLGMDIVPTIIYGSGRVMPKHHFLPRRYPIHFEIDSRIPAGRFEESGYSLKEQASAMRRYYKTRYVEIANRIEQDV